MKLKFLLPLLITLTVILIFHYTQFFAVKFYPVAANLTVFLIFFTSLFAKETVIQKIAKAIEGGLDDFTRIYTRRLTYVWCVFMFVNLLISIATVFMPEKWWALYNGCVSYVAIGVMFAVEYIVRVVVRKIFAKRNVSENFEWRLKSGVPAEGEHAGRSDCTDPQNASSKAGEPRTVQLQRDREGDTRFEEKYQK